MCEQKGRPQAGRCRYDTWGSISREAEAQTGNRLPRPPNCAASRTDKPSRPEQCYAYRLPTALTLPSEPKRQNSCPVHVSRSMEVAAPLAARTAGPFETLVMRFILHASSVRPPATHMKASRVCHSVSVCHSHNASMLSPAWPVDSSLWKGRRVSSHACTPWLLHSTLCRSPDATLAAAATLCAAVSPSRVVAA